MLGEFRNRVHRRGESIHATVESALLTANALLFTLPTLIVPFLASSCFGGLSRQPSARRKGERP
jgi:hypothetical protein